MLLLATFIVAPPTTYAEIATEDGVKVYVASIFTSGAARTGSKTPTPIPTNTSVAHATSTAIAANTTSTAIATNAISTAIAANATSTAIAANTTSTAIAPSTANPNATARVTGQPNNGGTPTVSGDPCTTNGQSPQQQAMIKLLTSRPPQERPVLRCSKILMEQALHKAQDMIARKYYGHVDIDGFGMNYIVRKAGYPLPSYYQTPVESNNIEALAAGPDFAEASAAFQGYLNSPKHKPQVLGLTPGWAAQDEYGVGFAYSNDSKYGNYWVVLTAKNGD